MFNVAPHAAQAVTVEWTPSTLGAFSGSVTVQSDDAGEPEIIVPCTGNAIPAPVMVYDPTSFNETLFSGNDVPRTLTVSNTGLVDAPLSAGQRILEDDVPAGPTYGVPVVGNFVNVTNSANVDCSIASNTLTCEAGGGGVTIGASGSFEVAFSVTPNASGALSNPAGICRVDPDDNVAETDETNNDCPMDSVNAPAIYLPLVLR